VGSIIPLSLLFSTLKLHNFNSHIKSVLTILTFNGWGVGYSLAGVEKKYNRHSARSGAKYKTTFWRWFSGAPGGVQYVRVNSVKWKGEMDSGLILAYFDFGDRAGQKIS
jgi:hypothetical protein